MGESGMKVKRIVLSLIVVVLAVVLAGCRNRLPPDAKAAAIGTFDPIDEPRIDSVKRAKPLPEDVEMGAEEVWCVNFTFLCWTPPFFTSGEHTTCADSRLVRLIDGGWQVSLVVTDEDKANWEARGCELMPNHVDMPG
jgi:hypothetical protein